MDSRRWWLVFPVVVSAGFFCALVTGAFIGVLVRVESWLKGK